MTLGHWRGHITAKSGHIVSDTLCCPGVSNVSNTLFCPGLLICHLNEYLQKSYRNYVFIKIYFDLLIENILCV